MNSRRRLLYRAGALLIVIGIAAAMFIIGRGHTIYFDNKTAEYNGQSIEAPYRVTIRVDDEQVAKLDKKERGMTTTMGQNFDMTVEILDEKGGTPHTHRVRMQLPYNMDGIILNIPALMAGLPADAYLQEFIAAPVEEETDSDDVTTDEFGLSDV